ncbi:MAG: hypothetical protein JSS43_11120, partial [Proteobacteria bacterium]|nr:hypothetical protein [Pseudomonadota bacterium]
ARLGDDIGPYLGDAPEDRLSVRRMAWNLVAAYAPQTEAEVLHGGRIVSLSFTLLDLLNDARRPGHTPALKLKYATTVVAVNRTICDAERTLERQKRAHCDEGRQVHRITQPPHDHELDARVTAMAEAAMAEYRAAVAERRAAEAAAQAAAEAASPAEAAAEDGDVPAAPEVDATADAAAATPPDVAAGATTKDTDAIAVLDDADVVAVLEAAHAAARVRLEQMKASYKGAPPPHSKAAQDIQRQQRVVDAARLKLVQARQNLAVQRGPGTQRSAA